VAREEKESESCESDAERSMTQLGPGRTRKREGLIVQEVYLKEWLYLGCKVPYAHPSQGIRPCSPGFPSLHSKLPPVFARKPPLSHTRASAESRP
jgi:hypothetical protein